MEGVTVVDHPLVQHKLTLIRDKTISTKSFRELLKEIGMLLCYEVTRDLPLTEVENALRQDRRKEAGVRAGAARRRDLCRRHARSGSDRARRAYRSLSRTADVRRRRIFLQVAVRSARAAGDRGLAGACDREHGGGGGRPSEGARRQGHPAGLPACRAGRRRALSRS